MSDVNLDGLERDEAIFVGPVCANCGGERVLTDGWCSPCLKLGRWSPKYLRADYRFQITVPEQARLCRCHGRWPHVHQSGPAVYKFVTRAGAEAAAGLYSRLAEIETKRSVSIEVEEIR